MVRRVREGEKATHGATWRFMLWATGADPTGLQRRAEHLPECSAEGQEFPAFIQWLPSPSAEACPGGAYSPDF